MLAGSQYYLYRKGQYLDEVDMDLNSSLYPLIQVSFLHKRINEIGNGYYGTLSDRVKTAIQRWNESKQPYIIAFKGGARHTDVNNYTWRDREKWIESDEYQRWVKNSNVESEEIINFILENDPEALIVLLGDHGAWSYRGFPYDDPTSYEKYNVREEDVFDDAFRVLLAYRLPGGAQDDIAHGLYMNNVNIFTHIFAYLAEDPSLLEHRTPSVSTLGKAKMVEGKLVRE